MEVAKNAWCPCGSGKRYQDCCITKQDRRWTIISRFVGVSVAISVMTTSFFLSVILVRYANTGQICIPVRGTAIETCNNFAAFLKIAILVTATLFLATLFFKIWGGPIYRKIRRRNKGTP